MFSGKRRKRHALAIAAIFASSSLLPGCGKKDSVSVSSMKTAGETSELIHRRATFDDVTAKSGIDSVYDNGEDVGIHSIVESLGGGVGLFDFDADGLDDIYFPGGGTFIPNQPLPGRAGSLFRNAGEFRFQSVAPLARADKAVFYSHGCAMADFDADGFADFVVTGYGGLQLFRNQGDGTFEELSRDHGMTDSQWSSSAAWADFNSDGLLDLFVTNYVDWSWDKNPPCAAPTGDGREVCSPQDFNPLLDLIYFNNGDGSFRAASEETGINVPGKGLGVVALDANGDSAIDIYVANDTTNNLLYLNDGSGTFRESGVISGTAFDQRGVSNGSMGLAVLDYNNDLLPDVWVTNYENETFALYHNDSGGMFRCLTEGTGVTAIGTLYVGFGTVAADFTRSGHEDIVVSNGHVMRYPVYSPIAQEPIYLNNSGTGKLSRQSFDDKSYFSKGHRGRGVVTSDLDQDGKLDLVFSHVNEPASLLQQTTALSGAWLAFKLIGTTSNRDAIGARVILETDKRKMLRMISGGGSYLSQNPYLVNFGIPNDEEAVSARIEWPNGDSEIVAIESANQVLRIVQNP
jgi:enediyne biosynthesis protein E4